MYIYSPRPIDDYSVPFDPADEVGYMRNEVRRDAIWNLFWLSNPNIDQVLDTGPKWWRFYAPTQGLLHAVITDVNEDISLFKKLCMHPAAFLAWFEQEDDYTIFDTYVVAGESQWPLIVMARAREAIERIASATPDRTSQGNVVQVNFRRRTA